MRKGHRGADHGHRVWGPRQTVSRIDEEGPVRPVTCRVADEDFDCIAAPRDHSSSPKPAEDREVSAACTGSVLRPLTLYEAGPKKLEPDVIIRTRSGRAVPPKAAYCENPSGADVVPDRIADRSEAEPAAVVPLRQPEG